MFLSSFTISRRCSALRLSALAAATMAALALTASAQGTHLWTQSRLEEFEKGTPQGVALSSDGHLRTGPGLTELLTTPSTTVWSVAVDKTGTAYLGTASPATVLRVGTDGKPFTLFETKDLTVQVVRLGPDGALYAATLPSGKVYRLKPDATAKQDESSATVVFDASKLDDTMPGGRKSAEPGKGTDKSDAKSHYIWEMTFDAAGRLYIATGGPGAVYRVDVAKAGAKPELFFKSDEGHIRSLAWDAKGNLIAGSDGSGLVYRISPDGKGYVLFEAPRREITSVAVAANGTIYAASVGDKSRNPLPPLPVQGVGSISITIVQPGSMQAANSSASVPEGSEIYALTEGQAPRKLWSGKDEVVYALAAQPDGLLALTGNRGRIFKIAADGSYADIGHLACATGVEPAPCAGRGRHGRHSHRHRQHRQACPSGREPRSTNTPAMCSMPARWPALAASRLSPARPVMNCSPAPAMSSSPCAAGLNGSRSRTARWHLPPAATCNGRPCSRRRVRWARSASTTCPSTPLQWSTILWLCPAHA